MVLLLCNGPTLATPIQVDPARSRIQVDVKATGHEFTGTLEKYTITAAGDASSHKPTRLELSWDFNDLKTGEAKRDKEMITWLGGGKPKGSFSFSKSWDEKSSGGSAQGNLTIHGVTKVVAFNYTLKREGDWVTVDGVVPMNYQAFNLPIIRAMAMMTVNPELKVRFHIVGKAR